jgi:hypothetical protein
LPRIVPIPFDMLMRPIKYVDESGDIFVVPASKPEGAESSITVLLDEATFESSSWHEAATITDEELPFVYAFCGAYGEAGGNPALGIPSKPTYVIGGQDFDPSGGGEEDDTPKGGQLILVSHDGVTWKKARRGPPSFVYVMGWHETKRKFYAQAVNGDFDTINVLESEDGTVWSTIDSHGFSPDNQVWASPQLQATGHPEVKDEDGNTVPNGGIFGFVGGTDESILIAPRPVGTYRWYTEPRDEDKLTNIVDITRKVRNPETGAVDTIKTTKTLSMDVVKYVGTVGGIWQAAGYDVSSASNTGQITKIANSTDNTWIVVYSSKDDLACSAMLAGSREK